MEPLSNSEIADIARTAVEDAVDFVESSISMDRIRAQKYYDGEVDFDSETGRSSIVATTIRDTIRQCKPSLMRLFTQAKRPVEFVAQNPAMAQMCENASDYVCMVFENNNGYRVLYDAIHDALLCKVGIVKVYFEQYDDQEHIEYTDLTDQEVQVITSDPSVQVVEQQTRVDMREMPNGEMMQETQTSMRVIRTSRKGKICMDSVPPEEFFVDVNATCIEDAYVCAHRTDMRVADAMDLGITFEALSGLDAFDDDSGEEFERKGYTDDDDDSDDPTMRRVGITEAYMRIDVDGTGNANMHRILLGGSDYSLLKIDPWDEPPFAAFQVDPIPHAFYGMSIADVLFESQDAETVILRGVLDNVALTNNPRQAIIDGSVNIDDLINNEVGGIVRTRQQGAIQPLTVPYVAGQTLSALQYLDQQAEAKSGINAASGGLSPDALQATTAAAVNAIVQQNTSQIEIMARNLAEGGVKRLFKLLLSLVVENSDEQMMARVSGFSYVPMNPRSWDFDMDTVVNVGLGTGQDDTKAAALMQTMQTQKELMMQFGMTNGVVTPMHVRNTIEDLLQIAGIQNSDRYFAPIDPQRNQQIMQGMQQKEQQQQQMQQQQAQQQNNGQALVQAEQIKAQAKMQTDMARLQQQGQIEMAKMQQQQNNQQANMQMEFAQDALDRDLDRDKLDADILLKAADLLGKYGIPVDVAQIYALMNAPRS